MTMSSSGPPRPRRSRACIDHICASAARTMSSPDFAVIVSSPPLPSIRSFGLPPPCPSLPKRCLDGSVLVSCRR